MKINDIPFDIAAGPRGKIRARLRRLAVRHRKLQLPAHDYYRKAMLDSLTTEDLPPLTSDMIRSHVIGDRLVQVAIAGLARIGIAVVESHSPQAVSSTDMLALAEWL